MPDSGRRCGSGTAAWASGARWPSVASAPGSAAGGAGFRCRPSPTRLPRESSWRRPSVGSATTSTRSFTAAKPRCRGAWRSSTAEIPSGYIDPHSLDGISTGQVAFVVQPTFLYELIWNVLVFVALIYVDRRFSSGHGRLFALYVAGYCVGRFCVELLRDDTATHIAGIRINSFTSTFVFIGAVVYIMVAPKGREDPASLRGNEYLDEERPSPSRRMSPQRWPSRRLRRAPRRRPTRRQARRRRWRLTTPPPTRKNRWRTRRKRPPKWSRVRPGQMRPRPKRKPKRRKPSP